MSKLKVYTVETSEPVYAELSTEGNKYITETAGFVPLEVKLKRFEEAGIQMQFQSSEFTSTDYRNMYLNPDFEINPEDDLEDIQEKIAAREAYIVELKKSKASEVTTSEAAAAGTPTVEKQTAEPKEEPVE